MRPLRRVLVIVDSRLPAGFNYLSGVLDHCVDDRWEVHVANNMDSKIYTRINVTIREWKPDGIIGMIYSNGLARIIRESGLPAVHVGFEKRDFPTVRTDDEAVGRLVARHFLDNGFRRFAYFSRFGKIWAQERCAGFVAELRGAGFGCAISTHRYIGLHETNWMDNRSKIDRWLQSLEKPVAIMAVHDTRGAQLAWGCRRLGISVPDDVAIVGVENQKLICRTSSPPLSSVELGSSRVGYEAGKLLDRLIRGHKPPRKPLQIPPRQVIVRQSSDVVAVQDAYVAQAVRMIRGSAGRVLSVKEIMQEIPISRRSMEQRFTRHMGRTPWEEIMRVRINLARNLLEDTDLPIPSVAQGAGFGGPEVFAVSFHQRTGQTPTEYRRKSRLEGQQQSGDAAPIKG